MERKNSFKIKNGIFFYVTLACAFFIPTILFIMLISLFKESLLAIKVFGLFKFITTSTWNPIKEIFGAASMIFGTLTTTILALIFAIPTSLGIAIFITQICPKTLKDYLSLAIELLASIPSIIYGMWGLFILTPIMANTIEPFLKNTLGTIPYVDILFKGTPLGIDLLTASLILSIMTIPFITSVVRDSFELVPVNIKESAYGMGSTGWEVVKNVILPYSKIGIYGGIILGFGRAIGETMAVAFVLGNRHEISLSLLSASSTIPVTLANEFTEADSQLYLSSLFYLALLLFISSFIILFFAKFILTRINQE